MTCVHLAVTGRDGPAIGYLAPAIVSSYTTTTGVAGVTLALMATYIQNRPAPSFLFIHPPAPPPRLLLLLQLLRFRPRHSTVPDLAVEDQGFGPPGPFALADFASPVEVRAADVEGVDVAGDDAAEEENAVEEGVGVRACEEEDG